MLTTPSTPGPDAGDVAALIRALRVANHALRRRSIDDILGALDRVVDAWLSPNSPWQRQAEERLPDATGFSVEMIRDGLPRLIEPLRTTELRALLERELGPDPRHGPPLIAHIMSGNIPGLSASSIVLSLAIQSCALVKAAHGDREFPQLFAESIQAADRGLGACVATTYWSGGDRAIEDAVFGAADLVVAFGSDASIAALRSRCRRTRFIGHGHRISFAVVAREVVRDARALETAAAALAEDVAMWDQRGCLSPQVCFVEGDFGAACEMAGALARELGAAAHRWPPGRTDLDQLTAIRRFRDDAEWRALAGERVRAFASPEDLAWSLVVEADPVFQPTPLGRSVRLLPVENLDDIGEIVAPARSVLEAAGVAASAARRDGVRALLAHAGVHWITEVGSMQRPPLSWSQGGRPRVADWVAARS